MNTITIDLEDENNEEVVFNGETLTFSLQMIEIWTIKLAFKKLKVILIVLEEDIDLLQQNFMEV